MKALQMALSSDSLGGGLDEGGRLPGYDISFHFKRFRSFGEYGHFYDGKGVGLWLAPSGPHEGTTKGSAKRTLAAWPGARSSPG